ncbi:MAG TPA: hypothetical protein VL122_01040 [Nitrospirota bacterium]|nr:hypothetical protein [Nitrospirota bacterium]
MAKGGIVLLIISAHAALPGPDGCVAPCSTCHPHTATLLPGMSVSRRTWYRAMGGLREKERQWGNPRSEHGGPEHERRHSKGK